MPIAEKFRAAKKAGGNDPDLERYMEDDIGAHGDLEAQGFGEETEVNKDQSGFDASRGGHPMDKPNFEKTQIPEEPILKVSEGEIDELVENAFKKDKNS